MIYLSQGGLRFPSASSNTVFVADKNMCAHYILNNCDNFQYLERHIFKMYAVRQSWMGKSVSSAIHFH